FHYPLYSKGSNESDDAKHSFRLREKALPILEAYGVDLILSGHSHSYERSKFLSGHYGPSSTLAPSHLVDSGNGSDLGGVTSGGTFRTGREDGAYQKPAKTPSSGFVAAVVGSSSKISPWNNGSTRLVNPQPHPVMEVSLQALGSLVVDIDGDRLNGQFIGEEGEIRDDFTIRKGSSLTIEPQSKPGEFEVRRTGAIRFPLEVSYRAWANHSTPPAEDVVFSFEANESSILLSFPQLNASEGITVQLAEGDYYLPGGGRAESTPTGPVANRPPRILSAAFFEPGPFPAGSLLRLDVDVSDPDDNLEDVRLTIGEGRVLTDTLPPYQFEWSATEVGNTPLIIRAEDTEGLTVADEGPVLEVLTNYFPESNERIVFEAEDFAKTTLEADGPHRWAFLKEQPGFSGRGYTRSLPVTETILLEDIENLSPEMRYPVRLPSAGNYHIWIRGRAGNTGQDSAFIGFNRRAERSITFSPPGIWTWAEKDLTVSEAGLLDFSIFMREDGVLIDKVIITRDSAIEPEALGPETTPKAAPSAIDTIDLIQSPDDSTHQVKWASVAGRTYEIHYKTSIAVQEWTTIASVEGNGGTLVFADSHPDRVDRAQGFYRVFLPES
ncbi:MAG: hypothetical protein AAF514_21720, partial [Verrucomicrobiota bacterium]